MSPFVRYFVRILSSLSYLYTLSQSQLHDSTLSIHTLTPSVPVSTYSGVSGIYNDKLIFHSSFDCNSTHCTPFADNHIFSLDISSLQINANGHTISLSNNPSWTKSSFLWSSIPGTDSFLLGAQTSGFTQFDQYTYSMNYGCCGTSTDTLLIFDLSALEYIYPSTYNYQMPGGEHHSACNTNDGDKYIYSIGGYNDTNNVDHEVAITIRYDIDNQIYEVLDEMNVARRLPSCVFVLGKLYALGGQDGSGKLSVIEEYDVDLDQWSIMSVELETPRNQHISVRHPNDWIITIGGRDSSNDGAPVEFTDVINGLTSSTDMEYVRKQFLTATLDYDSNTKIVFMIGGFIDGVRYDDMQYIVLSGDDGIFPTMSPTDMPSQSPTKDPTGDPTEDPTSDPTEIPSSDPTPAPTNVPTKTPTKDPTIDPTADPTNNPSSTPTTDPTARPSDAPIVPGSPTGAPSTPTKSPSKNPSSSPSLQPTPITTSPSTTPSRSPSNSPTVRPTEPTAAPAPSDGTVIVADDGTPTAAPITDNGDEGENPEISPTVSPTKSANAGGATNGNEPLSAAEDNLLYLIVGLLAVCVVGLSCLLFFKRLKEKNDKKQREINKHMGPSSPTGTNTIDNLRINVGSVSSIEMGYMNHRGTITQQPGPGSPELDGPENEEDDDDDVVMHGLEGDLKTTIDMALGELDYSAKPTMVSVGSDSNNIVSVNRQENAGNNDDGNIGGIVTMGMDEVDTEEDDNDDTGTNENENDEDALAESNGTENDDDNDEMLMGVETIGSIEMKENGDGGLLAMGAMEDNEIDVMDNDGIMTIGGDEHMDEEEEEDAYDGHQNTLGQDDVVLAESPDFECI